MVAAGLIEIHEPQAVDNLGELVASWVETLDPQMIEGASLDSLADLSQSATAAILQTLARIAREQFS
jgi:hypothetical protein